MAKKAKKKAGAKKKVQQVQATKCVKVVPGRRRGCIINEVQRDNPGYRVARLDLQKKVATLEKV